MNRFITIDAAELYGTWCAWNMWELAIPDYRPAGALRTYYVVAYHG